MPAHEHPFDHETPSSLRGHQLAQLEAQETLRSFREDAATVQFLLYSRNADRSRLDEGMRRCRSALDRFTMGANLLAISAPVYWLGLITLYLFSNDIGVVHVFAQPSGPTQASAFASHAVIHPPAALPLTLDGVTVGPIPVADLLP